ncbi:MAG: GAF domain-containing protein [Deltaproteobacteria bacterium]|nr:GAF domain-containing protein [Deltaproteobacteria bacterium]MBW2045044.1 GAF domain-containing protein [Deltaproteobacteria bacterium]MBW2299299.1 GAF domain-containing protein [Deltaproteobacteria bacterium]
MNGHTPGPPLEKGDIALKDMEKVYRKELVTMLKFGALINSSLNIERILETAMKWAEEFTRAEASSVYQLDEEKKLLLVRVARGEKKEPVRKIKLKLGEGIAGFVVKTGEPMVVQDVRKEKHFSDKFDKMTGFQTRSMICVPLIIRNKAIGALQVLNKKSGESFDRSDLELLVGMAQQIAIALENARLYQIMRKRVRSTTQELKITQEKLIRSERLIAMGHLVQGVAHEIRNPVMTIGGFAQRIKRELSDNNKLKQYLDIIIDESGRLEHLVRQVRQFAEVQTAHLNPESLQSVVSEVLRDFKKEAKKQGIKLKSSIPRSLPQIRLDASQIAIALRNVLENAVESMPNGGTLAVRLKKNDNFISMEVKDTGYGIAPDQLDSIYDPFVSSKTRGAGLGLTMVHQVVTNHHGEIKINSKLEKGTTVIIKLPITVV